MSFCAGICFSLQVTVRFSFLGAGWTRLLRSREKSMTLPGGRKPGGSSCSGPSGQGQKNTSWGYSVVGE